jgi:hypothetical protein
MFNFQDIVSTVAAPVVAGANMVGRALGPIANPIMSRLAASGLVPGGGVAAGGLTRPTSVQFVQGGTGASVRDWKVKITVSPSSGIFYQSGSGILDPLRDRGVVFPYTPQITVTYQANYSPQRFTHSNYNHYSYDNSEIQQIQISAEFTAQNQQEAAYVLACIYFFRAATKMFFGASANAGNPPPLVFLDGYGEYYFKRVPCLVTAFTHTMPADVDYIDAYRASSTLSSGSNMDPGLIDGSSYDQSYSQSNSGTKVPTTSTFQVGLQPVYSKETLSKFNLQEFSQGKLISGGLL